MRGNPKLTPKAWGMVRLYPNVRPDDKSIMLFGPGVIVEANPKEVIERIIVNV